MRRIAGDLWDAPAGTAIVIPTNVGWKRDGSNQQGLNDWSENKGVGHAKGWRIAAEAMGVEWMDSAGTSQAIPPAYTLYLGTRLAALP